jgi:hypothetical protein
MLHKTLDDVLRNSRVRSEAYRLRLVGLLWWANLLFMVLPAALATAAAVFAATNNKGLTAGLAGAAAVLTAVHKTLKCDEYQAECLRLSQRYRGLATLAQSVIENNGNDDPDLPTPQKLILKYAELEESATAMLTDRFIVKAEESLAAQEERRGELDKQTAQASHTQKAGR